MKLPITILFLVTTIANRGCYAAFDKCPSGDAKPSLPGPGTTCLPENVILFNGYEYNCCDKSYFNVCSHTGMTSRFLHNIERTGFVYTSDKSKTNYIYSVYQVTNGTKTFACPYPMGFLWHDILQKSTNPLTIPNAYLPTDHKDTTSILKACRTNKECAEDEFCGDVLNYSVNKLYQGACVSNPSQLCVNGMSCLCKTENQPNIDEKQHFCYKSPEITGEKAHKTQYAIRSFEKNFKLCHNNEDCLIGSDQSAVCHLNLLAPTNPGKWSQFFPHAQPERDGSKAVYPGICVEAKPISYVLSKVYDNLPVDDRKGEIGKKYLPTDYGDGTGRRDLLKKCEKNSDCVKGEFCGNIFSLSEAANFDSSHKFCFVVPESGNTPYAVIPEATNLIPCNKTEDCHVSGAEENLICLTGAGLEYPKYEDGNMKVFNGLCAKEEQSSTMIIIIVVAVVLVVIILAALIGGFVFYKFKMKKGNKGKKGKNDKSELTKKKKNKKGKKKKKGNKASVSASPSTDQSTSVTGKSGMGTTTGGYSPAIH